MRQIHNTGIGDVDPEERKAAALPQRLRTTKSNGISGTAGKAFALEVFEKEKVMKQIEDIVIGARMARGILGNNVGAYMTIAANSSETAIICNTSSTDQLESLILSALIGFTDDPEERVAFARELLVYAQELRNNPQIVTNTLMPMKRDTD